MKVRLRTDYIILSLYVRESCVTFLSTHLPIAKDNTNRCKLILSPLESWLRYASTYQFAGKVLCVGSIITSKKHPLISLHLSVQQVRHASPLFHWRNGIYPTSNIVHIHVTCLLNSASLHLPLNMQKCGNSPFLSFGFHAGPVSVSRANLLVHQ